MTQTKVLISTDPAAKTATVQQGLAETTVVLDPWPSTADEVETQAFAAVGDLNDDYAKIPLPPGMGKEVTEL